MYANFPSKFNFSLFSTDMSNIECKPSFCLNKDTSFRNITDVFYQVIKENRCLAPSLIKFFVSWWLILLAGGIPRQPLPWPYLTTDRAGLHPTFFSIQSLGDALCTPSTEPVKQSTRRVGLGQMGNLARCFWTACVCTHVSQWTAFVAHTIHWRKVSIVLLVCTQSWLIVGWLRSRCFLLGFGVKK